MLGAGRGPCALPSSFSSFPGFDFFFLFPFSLPSLRGGAKGDGPAGSLTLALPLCPPPAAAFPSQEPGWETRRKSFGLFPLLLHGDTSTSSQSPHIPPGGPTLPSPLKRLQKTSRSCSVRRKQTQLVPPSPDPTLSLHPSVQLSHRSSSPGIPAQQHLTHRPAPRVLLLLPWPFPVPIGQSVP